VHIFRYGDQPHALITLIHTPGTGATEVVAVSTTMLLVKKLDVKGSFRCGVGPLFFLHRCNKSNLRLPPAR